jgi:hypothetical protein
MAFHRIHFLANETPSSKSLNHFLLKIDIMQNKLKPFVLTLLLLLAWSFSQKIQATHLAGGELTYRYVSPASGGKYRYQVTFTWIRDCSAGAYALGSTETLHYDGCGDSLQKTMNRVLVETITPVCDPSLGCGQSSPAIKVYERHVYSTHVELAPCDSWTFWVVNYSRNAAIITTGVTGSLYIEATLNSQDYPTNSSPTFTSIPNMILCAGQPFNFNQLASDPDGDIMEHVLTSPLNLSFDIFGNPVPTLVNYTLPFSYLT